MPQQHGDRLSAVDASFLAQEGPASHMHVGAVLIFQGPPPAYEDFCNQIRSRLHLVPRYRQKLAFPPLETGRPLWVDDTSFNLEYHVRHTALPEPGSELQLRALAARVHSQQLDRSKPLWETWLVEGLEGDRFALISKTHQASTSPPCCSTSPRCPRSRRTTTSRGSPRRSRAVGRWRREGSAA
jgi:diacylglycerol O-acyltransferase / wax synthase